MAGVNRSFKTAFTPEQLTSYQRGVRKYAYRGRLCNKSPIDLALYIKLIDVVSPRSLIEIGSYHGGSAHLFADLGRMLDKDMQVVSIDVNKLDDDIRGVRFVEGSILDLDEVFRRAELYDLPRPWLVIEDSAHTRDGCFAALEFFATHLEAGEILVMEDGVLEDLGMTQKYAGGPNRAIAEFMEARPGLFDVMTDYCDAFGVNMTYNPNGYLRRTAR